MKKNRIFSLLGLAQKAGKVASGEFATENAVRSGRACLVIGAEDASENTKKTLENMTDYYEVPLIFYGTKEELGACIGKEYRSMAAVLDRGFSDSLIRLYAQQEAKPGEHPGGAGRNT